jgi:hypothetical protein
MASWASPFLLVAVWAAFQNYAFSGQVASNPPQALHSDMAGLLAAALLALTCRPLSRYSLTSTVIACFISSLLALCIVILTEFMFVDFMATLLFHYCFAAGSLFLVSLTMTHWPFSPVSLASCGLATIRLAEFVLDTLCEFLVDPTLTAQLSVDSYQEYLLLLAALLVLAGLVTLLKVQPLQTSKVPVSQHIFLLLLFSVFILELPLQCFTYVELILVREAAVYPSVVNMVMALGQLSSGLGCMATMLLYSEENFVSVIRKLSVAIILGSWGLSFATTIPGLNLACYLALKGCCSSLLVVIIGGIYDHFGEEQEVRLRTPFLVLAGNLGYGLMAVAVSLG